jgi:hypothetical protein
MFGAAVAIAIAVIDHSRLREGLPENVIAGGVRAVFIGGVAAFVGSLLRSR